MSLFLLMLITHYIAFRIGKAAATSEPDIQYVLVREEEAAEVDDFMDMVREAMSPGGED